MAEKNTISILESIKKKMQNFEKPRKPENSGLAAVGEEFDYITPSTKTDDKKDVAADKKGDDVKTDKISETVPNKPEDNFLEKELDESFTSFLSKTIGTHKEEKAPEKPVVAPKEVAKEVVKEEPKIAPIAPVTNDADDFLNNLNVDDADVDVVQEKSAKKSEDKIEAQPLMSQEQISAVPVADSLQDDSFDFLDDHHEETLVAQPAENNKQEHAKQEGGDDLDFDFLHDHELHDVAHELSAPQNQVVNQPMNQSVNQSVNQVAQNEKVVNNLPQNNNEFLKQAEQNQAAQGNNEVEEFLDNANNQAPQMPYNNMQKDFAPAMPARQQNYAQPQAVDDYSSFDQGLNQGYNSEMPQRQMPAVPPVRPAGMGNENMLRRKPTSPINPPIFNEAEFLGQTAGQTSWDAPAAPKADEFDEDAFLQEDENKLRQKYQETKEKAPAFSRNNAEMSSNKGIQTVNAVDSILKQQTVAQASDSIRKLMEAKSAVSTVASFAKGDNLNEIALQLLEPKLEKWLNENLPQIVEQIVREEIAKILPKQ